MTMLARGDGGMGYPINVLRPRDPISLQGFPYIDHPATFCEDDFALHFLGLNNQTKDYLCRIFIETGRVPWLAHRTCNMPEF